MRTQYAAVSFYLALVPATYASFHIADTFIGRDFLSGFHWETFDDPTQGRVNFINQSTALSSNLTYASQNKFVMRADDTKDVPPSARGRDSIRITSRGAYTDSVIVLDLAHMPEGCSTWPAFWTVSQVGPNPKGGEIDIIEGVNLQNSNIASLHTTPGCTMSENRTQSGSTLSADCDASHHGCSTQFTGTNSNSYGSSFNNVGGGWYVMQRTAAGINIWFWSRTDPTVPYEVSSGTRSVSANSSWGLPSAAFPFTSCDYASYFNAHAIIFDLTFCGVSAGEMFPTSGCGPGTCTDFVDNNPSAFADAYWEVNSLRVYTSSSSSRENDKALTLIIMYIFLIFFFYVVG